MLCLLQRSFYRFLPLVTGDQVPDHWNFLYSAL